MILHLFPTDLTVTKRVLSLSPRVCYSLWAAKSRPTPAVLLQKPVLLHKLLIFIRKFPFRVGEKVVYLADFNIVDNINAVATKCIFVEKRNG